MFSGRYNREYIETIENILAKTIAENWQLEKSSKKIDWADRIQNPTTMRDEVQENCGNSDQLGVRP